MKAFKNLSKRELILAYSSGFILLFAVIQYGYFPLASKEKELDGKIIAALQEIATQKNLLANSTSQRFPSNESTQKKIDAYLEENKQFAKMIQGLSRELQDQELQVLRLSAEKSEVVDGFTRTLYQLDVQAPFLKIGRLIENLESSGLLVDIESVDFSRDGDDLQRVVGKLSLSNYVVKE